MLTSSKSTGHANPGDKLAHLVSIGGSNFDDGRVLSCNIVYLINIVNFLQTIKHTRKASRHRSHQNDCSQRLSNRFRVDDCEEASYRSFLLKFLHANEYRRFTYANLVGYLLERCSSILLQPPQYSAISIIKLRRIYGLQNRLRS